MKDKLESYKKWAEKRSFSTCRLVHYVGVNRPNAINLEIGEILGQISGCLAEGLYVDWHEKGACLYLCVQEPGCPIPSWEKVILEEAIDDVDEILRKAGFGPNA